MDQFLYRRFYQTMNALIKKVAMIGLLSSSLLFSALSFAATTVPTIHLATTTSTANSGLLDYLLPFFTKETGINVAVISVGTGKALQLGKNGDVTIVLVHAPKQEIDYTTAGYGIDRHYVMYNDFVIVGPKNDPAKVKATKTIDQAMVAIDQELQHGSAPFISRGDNSGTEIKEHDLWKKAKVTNDFGTLTQYKKIGQGMSATLTMASELQGYTLTDRSTWLSQRDRLNLTIVFEKSPILLNPYHVILTNPAKHAGLDISLAKKLYSWLISADTAKIIDSYKVNGDELFFAKPLPNVAK